MPQTLYYVQLDNEHFGPFTLETIVDMHLTPDVLVLSTDTNLWKPACEYHELFDSLDLTLHEYDKTDTSETMEMNIDLAPTFNERTIFYVKRGDNPYGPYSLPALATVPMNDSTEVSVDGMMTWHRLSQIPLLINTLASISSGDNNNLSTDTNPTDDVNRISETLNRIQGLVPAKKQLYRRVFNTKEAEQEFLISEYNRLFETLINLVKELNEICKNITLSKRLLSVITNTVNEVASQVNAHYLNEFERFDISKAEFTTTSISIGKTVYTLLSPLEDIEVSKINFLTVLGDKNLCVTYDNNSEGQALDFVNSIAGKLYENNPARLILMDVIDTDFMTGLADSFKLLNRDLYKVISRSEEVRNILFSLLNRAGTIIRNLLVEKGTTLQDYNSTHDNKEANHLLVIKDFPHGLSSDNLAILQKLAIVGPKVGIYIVIMANEDELAEYPDKNNEIFNFTDFIESANIFSFHSGGSNIFDEIKAENASMPIDSYVEFANLNETDLKRIVGQLNSKCELREDVIVSIADYLPNRDSWWNGESAKQIEIPFGVGNDMSIKSLKITQESGQNTAVVIGIPGSGKSVFLHSLICSAAIKYSPNELKMYLIDFSGVEFNSYALGKLPHARVIAPEAEREFGLSILNELVEEGARRMTLCREHNVSNIVDLKRVAPGIKVPRLLVIIDEFQKLFEIENDLISREANSKIHIIIQEFRKFGINLILATQKLPSSSFLPRDLIANRIVFKSSPADFSALINTEGNEGMPRLRTGQCIYNSESGASYGNEKVQGYFVSKSEIDFLLSSLADFESNQSYDREELKVFRSAEQPDFIKRRLMPNHREIRKDACSIPVYLGESISVSDYDVNFVLNLEGANNLLIIGGEMSVAESICYHSLISVSTYHDPNCASMIIINGMRPDNPVNQKMMSTINTLPFNIIFPTKTSDIEETLAAIKNSIDTRRASNETDFDNIYIGIFDFQNCRAFDKDTSGRIEKPSAAASLLEYILRNGPSVGVFTMLQVDNLENLTRIGSVLNTFNYRIALQMPEVESNKVIGSPAANKLFVFNRPATKYRGYFRDNNRNLLIKFKPYKFS